MIINFKEFLLERVDSGGVVYHGTNNIHHFPSPSSNFYGGFFFSSNIREAQDYGKFLYECVLKNNIILFRSTSFKDCEILLDKFGDLKDEYPYSETRIISTPEQLANHSDNWEVIEKTKGILEWLEENYDGVIVTEGGVENVLLFDPVQDKLKSFKLYNPSSTPTFLSPYFNK